jgi:hypothetical protein
LPKLIGQSFILTWQLVNSVSKDLHNQTGTMQLLHFVLTVIILLRLLFSSSHNQGVDISNVGFLARHWQLDGMCG